MEFEVKMRDLGLCEMDSSELQLLRGGADVTISDIIDKIRNVFNFLADYLPKLLQGIKDGFLGLEFAK